MKTVILILFALLFCSCVALDQSSSILQDLTAATKAAASLGGK